MLQKTLAMKRAAVSSILVAVVLLTLEVAAEAMNIRRRAEGNWSWRCTEEKMSAADFDSLRELTKSSNRLGTLRRSESLRRRYEAGSTTFLRPSSTTRY